jgi:hypothetical protein
MMEILYVGSLGEVVIVAKLEPNEPKQNPLDKF